KTEKFMHVENAEDLAKIGGTSKKNENKKIKGSKKHTPFSLKKDKKPCSEKNKYLQTLKFTFYMELKQSRENFHKDHDYDVNDYYHLKDENDELIQQGYLKRYQCRRDYDQREERDRLVVSPIREIWDTKIRGEICMIFGGER
ncbi:hypothetical protein PanWU01x14_101570, partial [Parasponia andersonii]